MYRNKKESGNQGNWMSPSLRGWMSGEGGTTVDITGVRSSDMAKEQIQSLVNQNGKHSTARTTCSFIKYFSREGSALFFTWRKITTCGLSTPNVHNWRNTSLRG